MILALLSFPTPTDATSGPPPVILIQKETPPPAAFGPAVSYRVRLRPNPERNDETTVRGRKVRFRPTPEFDRVEVSAVGRDGTVLLNRSYYGLYATSQQSIVHGKVEMPVLAYGRPAFVAEYRDARDYAGSYYDPGDEPGATPPRMEPNAFVRENGRTRGVGRGSVVAWNFGGAVATKVQVDAGDQPSGHEMAVAEHVRVHEDGRDYDLGRVQYVGPAPGGAFVFADQEPRTGVYVWRRGRLAAWARLPKGWTVLATDAKGGLLARNGPDDSWGLGLLHGTTLRPLRLDPTKPSHDLAWSTVRSFSSEGKVLIDAYRGMSATPFTVALTPRRS